jgi:signal transduction histidine kinase
MASYPISHDEKERLQELFSYKILDTPVEEEFEDLVQIAVNIFEVPVAAISFIDADRQWMKARRGLDICEVNRELSVCNYTILQDQVLEVPDLQQDERFRHLPFITGEPFFRFYAGVPLVTSNGYKIGVLCLVDTKARSLNKAQLQTLAALTRQSMRQVELRQRNMQLENLNEQQRHISSRLSHDIKNPLSNIKMMLQMQQSTYRPLPEKESARLKDLLEQQVDTTIDMLNDMIQWGKLQLQCNEPKTQYTCLRQIAGEIIDEIVLNSSNKQNIIVNAIPANVHVNIDCDGARFALRNLLTNANKFTAQGCITISHEHSNGKDFIHVVDTGIGMNEEQTAKLNRNKQTDYANGTNNETSHGLGLGLLHDYLAQHNGQLLFQSEVGKGTKASFTL